MNTKIEKFMRLLVWLGGIMGLVSGLILGAFRFGWISLQPEGLSEPVPPSGVATLDGIAFVLVYTLPFALCLFALRFEKPPQASIWLGTSLLALLGTRSTFSFVSLLTMPIPAVLLAIAGLIALRQLDIRGKIPALGLAAALFIVGTASFFALFAQENQACWALVENSAGDPTWEPRQQNDPAQLSADPGPGEPIAWSCTSDVISTSESMASMALWALALLGLAGVLPQWKTHEA